MSKYRDHRSRGRSDVNALTTRLMQISLVMDDHIYYGKLITVSEAGGYLQEIATLKLQCLPTNARALQVIEKLTRCMRSILAEDTENAGNSLNQYRQMSSELRESASPVYSLPDEDKTYNTDDRNGDEFFYNICNSGEDELPKKESSLIHLSHERANIIKDSNCQNNVTTRSKVQYLSDPKPTLDDIPIIDITNTSDADEPKDIDADFIKKNVSIENVNAEMNNMSIQDEIPFQVPVGNRDCSQSILDNYDNENSNKVAREETVFDRKSCNKIDTKVLVANKVNNYFAQHTPTSNTCQKLPNNQPTEVDLNVNKESAKPTQPSFENKNKRVRRKNVANRKDEKVTKKNSKYSDRNAQNYQQNFRNTIMTTNATCNYKEKVPKTVKKKNRPNKKKACGIYNENVENDLSWVENIRYVREISPDEHDPALSLLPDNFWDNFALPDKWDDLDFEY